MRRLDSQLFEPGYTNLTLHGNNLHVAFEVVHNDGDRRYIQIDTLTSNRVKMVTN